MHPTLAHRTLLLPQAEALFDLLVAAVGADKSLREAFVGLWTQAPGAAIVQLAGFRDQGKGVALGLYAEDMRLVARTATTRAQKEALCRANLWIRELNDDWAEPLPPMARPGALSRPSPLAERCAAEGATTGASLLHG